MSETVTVQDIMSKPTTIAKSAPITEALDKMLMEGIDPLLVTHNGSVAGTISRKSIADSLGSKRTSGVAPAQIHVANQMDKDVTSAYEDEDSELLIPLLQKYKVVAVLNSDHKLVGKVDASDLLKKVVPDSDIETLMQVPHTFGLEERVIHLRRKMLDENITKFVVLDGADVVGVVTETDIAASLLALRKEIPDNHQKNQIQNLLVRDIMTSPALMIDVNEPLTTAIKLLIDKKISSIPVTKGGKIVGILTKDALLVAL